VELPDEAINILGAAEDSVAGGKDLLYGWLVGRAAADLGLAKALALSEAQHSDKIKRLEESLLGQIRELQKNDAPGDGDASAEMDALKAELQRVSESQRQSAADRIHVEQLEAVIGGKLREFENQMQAQPQSGAGSDLVDITFELKLLADRIARTEYSVQQAQAQAESQSQRVGEMVADRLDAETALLKTQLAAELVNDTAIATMGQSIEVSLQKQLDDLRAELGPGARAAEALGALHDHLAELSQRLGQIESAPSMRDNLADHENCWSQELDGRMARLEQAALVGTADLRAEIGRIKTRLDEANAAAPGYDLWVRQLEESVLARVGELQEKLTDVVGAIELRDVAMSGLNDQLNRVSGQLSACIHDSEESAVRTRELETRLSERLEAEKKSAADLAPLQIDMSGLLHRMTELELSFQQAQASSGAEAQRAQRVADALGVGLAALKADLGEQAMATVQSILANVEERFGAQINELQSCLMGALQDDQGRHVRLSEVQGEIHVIAGRLLQAESTTQQTHELVVNEAAQTAWLRDGVMNELAELRGQLGEHPASGGRIEEWGEALSARIDNLQDQLSGSIAKLQSRDAEIAELKAQIQHLSQSASLKPAMAASAVHRIHPPIGVTVGLSGVKTPTESLVQPVNSVPGEPNSLLQSFDAEANGSKEQKKQLQQRISADIERVRAELRKRAGVSRWNRLRVPRS